MGACITEAAVEEGPPPRRWTSAPEPGDLRPPLPEQQRHGELDKERAVAGVAQEGSAAATGVPEKMTQAEAIMRVPTTMPQPSPVEQGPSSSCAEKAPERSFERQAHDQVRLCNNHRTSHAPSSSYSVEVVTVQRNMLDDDVECHEDELEIHSAGQVVRQRTDPVTQHKYLRVRFHDGDELEV